jgi:diguanylate cyclase (GGDEF)-like protein/PAS domain S-box-containing protein
LKVTSLFSPRSDPSLERLNATLRDELARCQRALVELEANETHFRALVETSGDLVWTVDANGCFTYANGSAVEAILGYRAEAIIGVAFTDLATVPAAQAFDDEFYKLMESGGSMHMEGEFVHRAGYLVYLSVSAIALNDSDGKFIGASGTAVDVSEIKTAELLLRQALREQNAILNSATVGIAIVQDGEVVRVNAELERMFGYAPGTATGMRVEALCGVENSERWVAKVASAVAGRGLFDGDEVCRRRDGSRFWCRVAARVFDQSEGRNGTIWVLHDISDRKQKEQAIEHAALHDALTGLPNRALLSDRLEQAIKQASRANAKFGVLFVDLDRFKTVNDSIGHEGGDRLLRTIAERLRRRVRSSDTVARQGGDEFIVMVPELGAVVDVERVAENILAEIAKPVEIFGTDYVVTGSIGISLYPDHGTDAQSLLKHADAAMYHAKELGKNTYRLFTEDLHVQASEDIRIENLLRLALERKQLEVFYQPRIDLETGRVCSVEALARWRKSALGWVDPCKFIPVAERAGLIGQLGDWVLQRACHDLAHLSESGYVDLGLSVNLSHCQLSEPGLVEKVRGTLKEFAIDPRRLELELTETAIARDVEQAAQIMQGLEAAGISIAIDDFGTGYSSLSKLKCFPIRTLKIDRVFVDSLPHEEDDIAIVLAIIAMAKRLRIRVVAEGVENAEQRQFLVHHQCEEGQGHLFGKPMPLNELIEALGASARSNGKSVVQLNSKRRQVA